MLKETRAVVATGIQQGKTLDQEPWKKWSGEFITSDTFIETLYNDLTGKKAGKFIPHN